MVIFKYLIAAVIGGCAGFGAGWIFCDRKKQAYYDKQFSDMDTYYKNKYKKDDEGDEATSSKEDFMEVTEDTETPPTEYSSDVPDDPKPIRSEDSLSRGTKERRLRKQSVDYTKFYGDEKGEPMNADDEYDENYRLGLQATEDAASAAGPRVISELDFGKDPSIKTMTLNFYAGNGVLTVEDEPNEDVIEDFQEVEALLGDTLIRSGFDEDNNDVLYVRNERMGTDYQIIKVFAPYEDV